MCAVFVALVTLYNGQGAGVIILAVLLAWFNVAFATTDNGLVSIDLDEKGHKDVKDKRSRGTHV